METEPVPGTAAPKRSAPHQRLTKPASKGAPRQKRQPPHQMTPAKSEPEADPIPNNIAQNWEQIRAYRPAKKSPNPGLAQFL